MAIEIHEEAMTKLTDHATISIAFLVERILEVCEVDRGLGGFTLVERTVAEPWVKDYDGIKGEGPTRWAKRFDVSNWGLLSAHADGVRVGGCVLAFDTVGVNMLEHRSDLAVLWDMRVAQKWRRRGVGGKLFDTAVLWARRRGCRQLKVETQNINVPACRLYAEQGCRLGGIHRYAYWPDFRDEVQLLWYRDLAQ